MKHPILLIMVLFVTGCASIGYQVIDYQRLYGVATPKQRVLTPEQVILSQQQHKISFTKDVKPILDSRCVVCHGCYDAPCQLKLGSIEGLDRGATKQLVYDAARWQPASPTRLFVDANNTADWRKKEFYSVLNERIDNKSANLDDSVLAKLIDLKRLNPLPVTGKLDENYDFTLDRELQCPTIEEFPSYQHQHPQWGMPYAMPGLSLKQESVIKQWLQEGAKVEPLPTLSNQTLAEVTKWENYFNGTALKQKLVFRYIYEHLFIGHIHFKGHPDNEFFQWVRSKTPIGQPIEVINTVRPYDDPHTATFYYRLRPVTETIVDKTHFVYELSDEKKQRYDQLFFKPDYLVSRLPSYQPEIAANPFKAFIDLPTYSKYRFMLDDAYYFVSGFTKGPVCRGELATNSIRDQFWVVFIQPESFYPEKVAQGLAESSQLLGLPGEEADSIGLFGWTKFDDFGRDYLKVKNDFINSTLPKNRGFGLNNIWDGDGHNDNAALTVFRHFDSATTVKGLVGYTPLTAWVVDYPIFERLHYLLVAGFDIYGTTGHQLASRTYMDILRQDAENNFLRFMPATERQTIYNTWYVGTDGLRTAEALFSVEHPSEVRYQTKDYKKEFFELVKQRLGKAAGAVDSINHCYNCIRINTTPVQQQVDQAMRKLANIQGRALSVLPEMSLLRVKTNDSATDLVYTLLVDQAYTNLSMMLLDEKRRVPDNDKLTIVPGFLGSYPNFFFSVKQEQLEQFITLIENAKTDSDKNQLYEQFGVRRSNPNIWQQADWFNEQHRTYRGLEAGLLDMNRYKNL